MKVGIITMRRQKIDGKTLVHICMYCAKPTDDYIDEFDPETMVGQFYDQEPCEHCQAEMANGITLFGIKEEPVHGPDQEPVTVDEDGTEIYLTGDFLVLDAEAVEACLDIKLEPDQDKVFVGIELIQEIQKAYFKARKEVFGDD